MIGSIAISLIAFGVLYFGLRKRYSVLARAYGITALVLIFVCPFGLMANCLGIYAGGGWG
jgi:hypothetical protein